jgi:hypothetical protein
VFGFIVVVAFAFVVIAVIVVLKPIVDIQGWVVSSYASYLG